MIARTTIQIIENTVVLPLNHKPIDFRSLPKIHIANIEGTIPRRKNPKYLVKKMCFLAASSKVYFVKNLCLIISDLVRNQYITKSTVLNKISAPDPISE